MSDFDSDYVKLLGNYYQWSVQTTLLGRLEVITILTLTLYHALFKMCDHQTSTAYATKKTIEFWKKNVALVILRVWNTQNQR